MYCQNTYAVPGNAARIGNCCGPYALSKLPSDTEALFPIVRSCTLVTKEVIEEDFYKLTPLVVTVISVSLCVYNDIVNGRDIPNWSSSSGVLIRAVGLESSSAYVVVGLEDELDSAI